MSLQAVKGSKVLLKVADTLLVGSLSHDFSVSREMQDVTTKDSSGEYAEFEPGEKSATISIEGIYDPAASAGSGALDLFDMLDQGTKVALKLGQTESGTKYFACDAYVSEFSLGAPQKERTTYNGTFQVTGAVTVGTVV